MANITPEQIKKLVIDHLREILDFSENFNTLFHFPPERDELVREGLKETRKKYRDMLLNNDFSVINITTEMLMKRYGLNFDPDSKEYTLLSREILKSYVLWQEIELKRLDGDYVYEETVLPLVSPAPLATKADSILFKDAVRKFIAGKNTGRGKEWNEKTKTKFESSLGLAVEYFENALISEISHDDLKKYRNALLRFPSNRNKRNFYKNLTFHEITQMDIPKEILLDITTINDHISRLHSLFDYALLNPWGVKINPVKDLKLEKSKRDDKRKAFSIEQLTNLLRSKQYLNDEFTKPFQFWTPIIALFSGMRQNEIAQLYLDDIGEEDGIWYFRMQEDDDSETGDKSLKTLSSWRDVPFHPFLKELNLHEYCQFLRTNGQDRLFPDIQKGKYSYGETVSGWFNANYKLKCGIPKNAGLDYHSFRHNFIDWFKQYIFNSDQLKVVSEIVGHAVSKDEDALNPETMKRYGKDYELRTKFEVISQLDCGIDLSHLKNSKFTNPETFSIPTLTKNSR